MKNYFSVLVLCTYVSFSNAESEGKLPDLDDVLGILEAERPVVTTESRLTDFYQKYNPTKMADVPKLLKKFEGREEAMFQALEEKVSRLET
jgi:hypothetical protein